jgi:carbon monoxide dehydrogenase subunit G
MKLEQTFEVQAPLDRVWAALIDLERVAPCLPGAAITQRDEDGTYHGEFQVKLGPTTASYRGTIRIEDLDEAAHVATLRAKGTDKRGHGGASATIVNTLSEADGGTRVQAVTDFTITGRLASFGRGGMIKDISNRLLADFATCLQSRLGPEIAAAAGTDGAPEEHAGAGLPSPAAAATAQAAAAQDPPKRMPAPAPPDPAPEPPKPLNAASLVGGALLDRLRTSLESVYRAMARLFGRRGR